MADLAPYIQAALVGASAVAITGYGEDALTAGGYAAWVQAVTGSVPAVTRTDDNRCRLVMSQSQVLAMQQWLDQQVGKALGPQGAPPRVQMDVGPVFGPWAAKFAIPAGLGVFALGWLAHWVISGGK